MRLFGLFIPFFFFFYDFRSDFEAISLDWNRISFFIRYFGILINSALIVERLTVSSGFFVCFFFLFSFSFMMIISKLKFPDVWGRRGRRDADIHSTLGRAPRRYILNIAKSNITVESLRTEQNEGDSWCSHARPIVRVYIKMDNFTKGRGIGLLSFLWGDSREERRGQNANPNPVLEDTRLKLQENWQLKLKLNPKEKEMHVVINES